MQVRPVQSRRLLGNGYEQHRSPPTKQALRADSSLQTLRGSLHLIHTFDIGENTQRYSEIGASVPWKEWDALAGMRPEARSFGLDHEPWVWTPETYRMQLGERTFEVETRVTLYDFAGAAVLQRINWTGTLDDFVQTSALLYRQSDQFGQKARSLIDTLYRHCRSYLVSPRIAPEVEDYFVNQIDPSSIDNVGQWCQANRLALAQILRGEARPFADERIEEALERTFRETDGDQLYVYLPGALVINRDFEEILAVIQYVNTEYVELCSIQTRLSRFLADTQLARGFRMKIGYGARVLFPYGQVFRLVGLTADIARALDAVTTSIGSARDPYLRGVYETVHRRFDLEALEASLQRQQEAVEGCYDRLDAQALQLHQTLIWPMITFALGLMGASMFSGGE